jgi:hypothetical protein
MLLLAGVGRKCSMYEGKIIVCNILDGKHHGGGT